MNTFGDHGSTGIYLLKGQASKVQASQKRKNVPPVKIRALWVKPIYIMSV